MKWSKKVLQEVRFPYAVSVYDCGGRKKVVTATELEGPCTGIWADTLEQELLWTEQGGTMNTFQIEEDGSFLAIQRFYKGFNSREACLVKIDKKQDWKQTHLATVPFLHRFCVIRACGHRYVVCCILCADKASREDWSQAGCVKVARLPEEDGGKLEFQTVLEGVHRNHGLYCGLFQGEQAVLVTGDEGIFRIHAPEKEDDIWFAEELLHEPVSDCTVADIDGDGEDELITIEPFHGGKIVIRKMTEGQWKPVYSYPVDFGHAIWSGSFFGKPAFIIGYRGDNKALLLFRLKEKRDGQWFMDVTCIDEHGGPTNVVVVHGEDREKVFACNGASGQVVLYEFEE